MILKAIFLSFTVIFVVGCGGVAPIPSDTFYRLGKLETQASPNISAWTDRSIVVERIRANGIYKDRALALLKSDGVSLAQSDYHYWNDSPELLVQQRILEQGVRLGIAPNLTLDMVGGAAYVISGRLLRFERVKGADDSFGVAVELVLSVRAAGLNENPLFERNLNFSDAVNSADVSEAVIAISNGLDHLIVEFFSQASSFLSRPDASIGLN